MSSKPDKGKYGENIEDTTKDIPGQMHKPAKQGDRPGQPQQKDGKEDDRGKAEPHGQR